MPVKRISADEAEVLLLLGADVFVRADAWSDSSECVQCYKHRTYLTRSRGGDGLYLEDGTLLYRVGWSWCGDEACSQECDPAHYWTEFYVEAEGD